MGDATVPVTVQCGEHTITCDVDAEVQLRGLGEVLFEHQALKALGWLHEVEQPVKSVLVQAPGLDPMEVDALCELAGEDDFPIRSISPISLIVELEAAPLPPPPPPPLHVPLVLGGEDCGTLELAPTATAAQLLAALETRFVCSSGTMAGAKLQFMGKLGGWQRLHAERLPSSEEEVLQMVNKQIDQQPLLLRAPPVASIKDLRIELPDGSVEKADERAPAAAPAPAPAPAAAPAPRPEVAAEAAPAPASTPVPLCAPAVPVGGGPVSARHRSSVLVLKRSISSGRRIPWLA